MKDSIRKYYKICATCQFWQGMRVVDTSSNTVMTDSYSHAKCGLRLDLKDKRAMDTCIKWQRIDTNIHDDNEQ